jgi:tetratricopeptide (TPR) repeat protein
VARAVAAQEGLADCENALAQTGKNDRVNALTARGQAHLARQRNEAALADFEAALTEAPNAMRALYGQGVARERLGDIQGSTDKQEALRRLPGAGREFTAAPLR